MARAYGARSKAALAFETNYGVAPASGYTKIPFSEFKLSSEQPLISSTLLGYGRDPIAPIKDAITVDGDMSVPIDAEIFGLWLKAALGEPATTGSAAPYTHVFTTGADTIPSMSIELSMPEVPRYAMYSGCKVDKFSFDVQRTGEVFASVSLIAQGESIASSTAAGTPDEPLLVRFGAFNGSVKRNGVAIGGISSAQITYSNNLERIETVRSDNKIDGADPTIASLTGNIVVRFSDSVLMDQATNGTPCSLEFSYERSSSEKITFTIHSVYLPKPRLEVNGPNGIQATFDWQAAQPLGGGAMMTVTLINEKDEY